MSCRSTSCTSAATTIARLNTGLDDSQIQSLFHSLRREGKGMESPSLEEYEEEMERMIWHVRNDASLPEGNRRKMLLKLQTARFDHLPDGDTWYATTNISRAAETAKMRLHAILGKVATDIEVDPERIGKVFDQWREDKKGLYEDYPSPLPEYRYDLMGGIPQDKRTVKALRKLGYEQYLAQPLPVFVYGTLRAGQRNSELMDDARLLTIEGRVSGVGVYGSRHGFPYAADHEDPNAVVVGEIAWLSEDARGQRARVMLDHLEGFDSDYPRSSHYIRTHKTVEIMGPQGQPEQHTAWMYLAQGVYAERLSESDRIEHGDWVAEQRELFGSRYR